MGSCDPPHVRSASFNSAFVVKPVYGCDLKIIIDVHFL